MEGEGERDGGGREGWGREVGAGGREGGTQAKLGFPPSCHPSLALSFPRSLPPEALSFARSLPKLGFPHSL